MSIKHLFLDLGSFSIASCLWTLCRLLPLLPILHSQSFQSKNLDHLLVVRGANQFFLFVSISHIFLSLSLILDIFLSFGLEVFASLSIFCFNNILIWLNTQVSVPDDIYCLLSTIYFSTINNFLMFETIYCLVFRVFHILRGCLSRFCQKTLVLLISRVNIYLIS